MKTHPQLAKVRLYILSRAYDGARTCRPLNPDRCHENRFYVTVERTARRLKLSMGEVQQCFHLLNLEGLISQAVKSSFRHYPDMYYLTEKARQKQERGEWS